MTIESYIRQQLDKTFQPVHLEVLNESHSHNVAHGSETHFKVVVVTEAFTGQTSVQRHRNVYAALTEALARGVHALAIHTFTPAEWQSTVGTPQSPDCMGGSKR